MVLKAAVESDQKNKALADELKEAMNGCNSKIEKEKESLQTDREAFIKERQALRDEIVKYRGKEEEDSYEIKELRTKYEKQTNFLQKK